MLVINETTKLRFKANFKYLVVPVSILITLVALIIVALNIGISRIPKLYDKLTSEKAEIARLETKLSILTDVRNEIFDQSEKTIVALPDNDSVLWFLSVLKATALENNVEINSVDISANNAKELKTISFTLSTVVNERESITAFVQGLEGKAPVNKIESVNFSPRDTGGFASKIEVVTYWAVLPDELPALTSPITSLTSEEKEIVTTLSRLIQPEFAVLDPSEGSGRSDPFN